jgi:hypothetical protein
MTAAIVERHHLRYSITIAEVIRDAGLLERADRLRQGVMLFAFGQTGTAAAQLGSWMGSRP